MSKGKEVVELLAMGVDKAYARKIEPKYRPFANAEEFMPHRDRWIVDRDFEAFRVLEICPLNSTIGTRHGRVSFRDALSQFKFEDGTPFGVLES